MTPDELLRVAHEVVDEIVDYLTTLPGKPVFRAYPPDLGAQVRSEPVPRRGAGVDAVLADFRRVVEPFPFGNGHPRYAAWVNSPPHPVGILAEALAATMNPSVAGGDHAAVHVERQVVRWFAALAGLGPQSGGLMVSGGSAATLTAFAVARQRAVPDVRRVGLPGAYAVYLSSEGHGSARKAVEILGLGSSSIRTIDVDPERRMRPSSLRAAIEADLAGGVTPIAVMATAGTVNTGAIDPLGSIADVCAEHGVWLHVDAAYGGPALLVHPTYKSEISGLGRADSIAIDPHKWLYAPVGAGLLLLRDPALAREAFSLVPPYLQTSDEPWFSEYGIEQTRPFRALKVWMLLKHLGTDGYRDLIDHDLAVAAHLAATVEAAPSLELLAHGLSVVCFRVRAGDDHNRRVLAEVQNGGRAFLAGTTVDGVFALRACVVNPGMTREDAEAIVAEVIKGSLRAFPD